MGIKRDKSGKFSSQIVPRIWNSRPSCLVSDSSRTLPATQSKPGLLAHKLSEVQMSYFYLCLCVCQYLWIIKFLEWANRKKWGILGGMFIDWDIEGSLFVWFYSLFRFFFYFFPSIFFILLSFHFVSFRFVSFPFRFALYRYPNYVNENTRFSCRFKCLTQMTHL
jgi:hypothetical protein